MKLLNVGCGKRYHLNWTNVDLTSSSSDVIPHDLKASWPFPENYFDGVYHSHVLEHFSKTDGRNFLEKCFNVLKPGGVLRVVVPDFEQLVVLYLALFEKALAGDEEAQKRYEWIQLELFDQMVRNRSGGEMLEYMKQNPMPAEEFVVRRCGLEVIENISYFRSHATVSERKKFDMPEPDAIEIGKFRLGGEVHLWMYDRYSLSTALKETGFNHIRQRDAKTSDIKNFCSYYLDMTPDGSVYHPESLFMEAQKPEV